MRTKALLGLAALAAGALTAAAQSNVYSLNVVGYVNVATTGGGSYTLIANPLNNEVSNDITNLFAAAQDGDQVQRWAAGAQDFSPTIYTYSTFLHKWDGNYVLQPGEGIFYLNGGSDTTITFVGDVVQGAYVNPVLPFPGGGSYSSLGSSAPIGGPFTNATVGLPPQDGDQVQTWNNAAAVQDFSPTIATYSTFLGKWDTTAINVAPGIGFFYLNGGADVTTWTRNFTVQ